MLRLRTHTQIVIAIIAGIFCGVLFKEKTAHVKIAGDLFIRALKMIIVPLVMASMVTGVVGIGNIGKLGRIGRRTFVYYLATTVLAVGTGLLLVNIIRPGVGYEFIAGSSGGAADSEGPSVIAILTDIVPENIFKSMAEDKFLSVIFVSLL